MDEAHYINTFNEMRETPWKRQEANFDQLKLFLETAHVDSAGNEGEEEYDEDGDINPASARAAALPIVKLFPIGTHLLRVTPVGDPLPCVAFGTIDMAVYTDVFWEAIASWTNDSDLQIEVYDVHNGLFELSLGGTRFNILYRQCNELLRSYPDVTSAPTAFLKNPTNGCLHVCDLIETLKTDQERIRTSNMKVVRVSYPLIRIWALARGRMAMGGDVGRAYLMPKEILNIIFDYLSKDSSPGLTNCMKHFLEAVDGDYSGPMVPALRLPVFPDDSPIDDWPRFVTKFRKVPLRDVMIYPNYLLVSVVFICSSGMRGAKWLHMVEQRLWALSKTGSERTHNYTIWPTRLEADFDDSDDTDFARKRDTPYEGFYVVGYNDGDSIVGAIDKLVERAAKDKDTIPGECFMSVKSLKHSEFDTVFEVCERVWPRKPIPNPLEKEDKSRSQLDLPIRTKVKKVHKDGKKGGKESAEELASPDLTESHSKLRPASDVLKRLKYDPNLNIDEFVVGYVDRHTSKMQEKPAASWQRDTTHEEFIPEHRIQYFKKTELGGSEEILWDRRSRMDQIFKERSD